MKNLWWLILLTAICCFPSIAGGSVWCTILGHAQDWPRCVGCTCCDDYCPKLEPCPHCVQCFECPDYCPKCQPCARCVDGFTCDDYCEKPFPKVRCPGVNLEGHPLCPCDGTVLW
jgi:hypothetical protein